MGEAAIAGDCENEANIQIASSIDGKQRITKEENALPGELVTEVISPMFSKALLKISAPLPELQCCFASALRKTCHRVAFNRK